MRIDRDRIKENLERLASKGEERGMQPELILGCFYDLKEEDDGYCKKCDLYWKCEQALKSFIIKEEYK
jgi:hypothetical protein